MLRETDEELFPLPFCSNDNGIRPAAPRSAPTVGQHDVSCNEESRHLPLHEIQLNGKESPTSASLDKFQEELSTVNVANGSYQDEHTAEEMNCRELSEKEKLSLNSGDKVEACLPDLDDPSTSGMVICERNYLTVTTFSYIFKGFIVSGLGSHHPNKFCRCGGPRDT